MFGLAVLTVSTSGSQGKRDDSSGQAIKDLLEGDEFQVVRYEIVSDDKDTISAKLAKWADAGDVDLIDQERKVMWKGTTNFVSFFNQMGYH